VARDMRDPAVLGHLYLAARGRGVSVEAAAKQTAPEINMAPTCIDKYGSANDVKPVWMEVQVK